MNKMDYFAPCVEVYYVEVEEGFNGSQGDNLWGLPGEKPDENGFGEF